MISAVIVAFNEARVLKRCLKSVAGWADEIVVVDLGSTDDTRLVAKAFKCKVVNHKFVPYVELVRNFAIAQCKGDWILILDPDEQMSSSLKLFLSSYIKKNKRGALNIPRKNIFFGKWIAHTNFWPDYQVRFFSKGAVRWQKLLHSYPKTSRLATKLPRDEKYAIAHISNPTMEKHIRYAEVRAQEKYHAGERFSIWRLVFNCSKEFLSRYIKHQGYLDKKAGIQLTVSCMHHHYLVEQKLRALERTMRRSPRVQGPTRF